MFLQYRIAFFLSRFFLSNAKHFSFIFPMNSEFVFFTGHCGLDVVLGVVLVVVVVVFGVVFGVVFVVVIGVVSVAGLGVVWLPDPV